MGDETDKKVPVDQLPVDVFDDPGAHEHEDQSADHKPST